MRQYDNRTGIEVIDRKGCLRLLAGDQVGRLALIEGGTPLILPVNYSLDGEDVVLRTAPGAKLDAGRGSPASFEIDWFDRERREGWSVVVRGHLEEITEADRERWERVRRLPDPWAEGERSHVLALVAETMTGRRVGR